MTNPAGPRIEVPEALVFWHRKYFGEIGCAWIDALEEVLPEAGDRLMHEDLHFDDILAPHPADQREPWLAIDANPVAGDPGFALLAALHDRWEEAVATGDVPRAIRRRFDLMTEILGLDRKPAAA